MTSPEGGLQLTPSNLEGFGRVLGPGSHDVAAWMAEPVGAVLLADVRDGVPALVLEIAERPETPSGMQTVRRTRVSVDADGAFLVEDAVIEPSRLRRPYASADKKARELGISAVTAALRGILTEDGTALRPDID